MEIPNINPESSKDLAATVSLPVNFTRSLAAVLNPFLEKAISVVTSDSTELESTENKPEAITHQADSAVQSQKTAESPLSKFLNYFGVTTPPASVEPAVEASPELKKTETTKSENSEKTETPSMWSSIRKAVLSGIPGGTIVNFVVDSIPASKEDPSKSVSEQKSWYQSLLEDPLGTITKNLIPNFNLSELGNNINKGFTKLGDWLDSFDTNTALTAKQDVERERDQQYWVEQDRSNTEREQRYRAEQDLNAAFEQERQIAEAARIKKEESNQEERIKEDEKQWVAAREQDREEETIAFKQIASLFGESMATISRTAITSTDSLIDLMLERAKSSSPTKYAELLASLKHQSAFSNLISRTLSDGKGLAPVKALMDSNHGTDFIA